MANNYGTITITENSTAMANWANKFAIAIGEIIGEELTVVNEGSYEFLKIGENKLFKISITSSQLYIYIPHLSQQFNYAQFIDIGNGMSTISYIKSGNYFYLKFSPVYNSTGNSVCIGFVLHKDSTGWEVAPITKTDNKLLDFYNISTNNKSNLVTSFPFNSPAGKIYVCDGILSDSATGNFVEQTNNVLSCSNVGLNTNVRFNSKNYYAIAKNFVMEKIDE